MAGPAAAVAIKVAKKVFLDIITDPEKIIKFVFLFIFLPLLILILIFALPIILIYSLPSIMINGNTTPELTERQIEIISFYQEAPTTINKSNLEWIEQKKKEYSWCDDVVVSYDFDLSWQHLMAIDSVLLNQDFSKADKNKIEDAANRFVIKDSHAETYTVQEEYTVTVKDAFGHDITQIRTRTVTKHRAIINISAKPFETVLDEIGLNADDKQIVQNIYNNILGADVEGNLNIYDDVNLNDLKEYPPGSAKIPYFNQTDKRWGAYSYGNSTIKSGGCGPTSLAMVVAGLTGRSDIDPKVVANWSYTTGHRAEGYGSYWSLMPDGGRNYGLIVEAVSRKNPKKIVEALSNGYPIIACMGKGHFTTCGHFIVLRGITNDGKILVNDPASVTRTNQSWDLSIIINESSTNGGVNGSPFWIFKQ